MHDLKMNSTMNNTFNNTTADINTTTENNPNKLSENNKTGLLSPLAEIHDEKPEAETLMNNKRKLVDDEIPDLPPLKNLQNIELTSSPAKRARGERRELTEELCLCKDCKGIPDSAYDLLERLVELDPNKRISAEDALNHPFITSRQTSHSPVGVGL